MYLQVQTVIGQIKHIYSYSFFNANMSFLIAADEKQLSFLKKQIIELL
jgi:hypothetical protein